MYQSVMNTEQRPQQTQNLWFFWQLKSQTFGRNSESSAKSVTILYKKAELMERLG